MIGYHYTTREVWEQVQYGSLHPAPMRQHEYDHFRKKTPTLPRDAIWAWKEELTNEQALIVLMSLASMHLSFDLVLLRLDYALSSSAIHICKEHPDDRLSFTCSFSAGRLDTGSLPIDLILFSVPAANITKLWEVDLLAHLQGRHAEENNLVLV